MKTKQFMFKIALKWRWFVDSHTYQPYRVGTHFLPYNNSLPLYTNGILDINNNNNSNTTIIVIIEISNKLI